MIEFPIHIEPTNAFAEKSGAYAYKIVDNDGHTICTTCGSGVSIETQHLHLETIIKALEDTGPLQTLSGLRCPDFPTEPAFPAFGTRRYSVKEIDELRALCRERGAIRYRVKGAEYYIREDATVSEVEELVRTHMLAGHTAEDLIASEKEPAGG